MPASEEVVTGTTGPALVSEFATSSAVLWPGDELKVSPWELAPLSAVMAAVTGFVLVVGTCCSFGKWDPVELSASCNSPVVERRDDVIMLVIG